VRQLHSAAVSRRRAPGQSHLATSAPTWSGASVHLDRRPRPFGPAQMPFGRRLNLAHPGRGSCDRSSRPLRLDVIAARHDEMKVAPSAGRRTSQITTRSCGFGRRQIEVPFPIGVDPIEHCSYPQRGVSRDATVYRDLDRSAIGLDREVIGQVPDNPLAGLATMVALTAKLHDRNFRSVAGPSPRVKPASVERNGRHVMHGQGQAATALRTAADVGGPKTRCVEAVVALRAREKIHYCLLPRNPVGSKSGSPASDRDRPFQRRGRGASERGNRRTVLSDSGASGQAVLRPLNASGSTSAAPIVTGPAFDPGFCGDRCAKRQIGDAVMGLTLIALPWLRRPSGS
jgi:hypothetical protein